MAGRRPFFRRFRDFVRDYTGGFDRSEFRRLFDREASEAYEVLTRDQAGVEPGADFHRLLHRVRLLFLGISSKLTPVRRVLFAGSLLFFFFSLLDVSFDFTAGEQHRWQFVLDTSPFWAVLGFSSLLFLFALEMVDRVRVRDELEVARQLQGDLLPRQAPTVPGYRFAHSWRTANEVGGDSYDFRVLPDGRLAVMMGDASGHGMAAGLVMAIAHATLHTALDIDPGCEHVHGRLNQTICRTGDRRTFMSLVYGLLTPETGLLDYVLAGHPYPLLRRADGRVEELGKGSLPLGLRENLPVDCRSVTLALGDALLLYSDGLVEALSTAGEAFGFERLRALLVAAGSPQELHDRILAAFDRHTAGEPLKDDLTLVVLTREPDLPPLPGRAEGPATVPPAG